MGGVGVKSPLVIKAPAKVLVLAAAFLLTATACAEKKVLLEYRFPPNYEGHYEWTLEATRSVESPTETTTTRLEAVIDVEESVRRSPGGRTILAVRLRPLRVRENGEAAPVPPPTTAEYEIDPQGRIRRLVTTDLSAGAISSLELDTLASQVRPPLSREPVTLGGTWRAPLKISGRRTSINFRGAGRLVGFDLVDRRRVGRVEIERRGTIRTNQLMNNARVVLRGTSSSRGLSQVDLDRGVLFSSEEKTTSNFDVLLAGRPAAKLDVTLTSRLHLAPPKA